MNKRQTIILGVGAVIGIALIIVGIMIPTPMDYRYGPYCAPTGCYEPGTDLTPLLAGSGIGVFVLAVLLAISPWGRDRT